MVSRTPKLLGRLAEEAIAEVIREFPTALRGIGVREVLHRLLHVFFVRKQMVGVLQRHVGADFVERFQRLRDVGLRLILEEPFVALLSETCRSIDDEFGVSAVRNAAV